MKRAVVAAAALGLAVIGSAGTRPGAGAGHRRCRQDRRADRHVEPLFRHQRPGRGRRDADGDRRFRRHGARQEDRAGPGRRAEQARCRGLDRRALVRRREGRRDPGHRRVVVVDRDDGRRRPEEEDLSRDRPGLVRHHRQTVQPLHGALGLRHRGAGQRHRLGGGQGRRQELVLPHRRLRLRLRARARRDGGRTKANGGKVVGGVRAPDQHIGLLVVPAAGAGFRRQVIGLANAGGDTINSIKQAAEFGIVKGGQKLAGPAGLRHRRATASGWSWRRGSA